MKSPARFASLLLLPVLVHSAVVAQDISSWRTVVLDKPFHAGDSKTSEMEHRNPEGRQFTGSFVVPPQIKPNVATFLYVHMDIAGVSAMNTSELAEARKYPHFGTRLLINGQQISLLNELAKKGSSNSRYQKFSVRFNGNLLRSGSNEIQVIPGRRSQLDDIELRSVVVASRSE